MITFIKNTLIKFNRHNSANIFISVNKIYVQLISNIYSGIIHLVRMQDFPKISAYAHVRVRTYTP